MKKLTYIILATSILLAAGCTNELETTMQDGKLSFSSVSASMADLPTSRAHLEGGGKVVWDAGDNIGIYSDTQTTPVKFTCTDVSESNATFSSDDEVSGSNFVAYYPYENTTIDGNTMTYTLSNITEYKEGSYFRQCPMIAKSETNEFGFKHTCGIIRFSITGTQRIQSLVLEGNNGEIIAGMGTIDLTSDVPVLAVSGDGYTSITMTGEIQLSSTATDFYFIVPAVEFTKGLSLTINYLNDDSSVTPVKKSTTQSITISRSVIKSFNAFDTDVLLQEQEEERIYAALMAFYNATGGDNWTNNENWGSNKPFDEWYGIIDYRGNIENEEAFVLELNDNNLVGGIPEGCLSELQELTNIYVNNNKLTSIQLSGNNKLRQLWCENNDIKLLELYNTSVNEIFCSKNSIFKIDINSNSLLQTLNCYENPITELKIDSLYHLKTLSCQECLISSLKLENNAELLSLSCNNNKLITLNLLHNNKLQQLYCDDNQLNNLDISKNKELELLSCTRCNLNEINISGLTKLRNLFCGENKLKAIDVSNNPELELLWCSINSLSSLDISNNPKLYSLTFGNAINPDGSINEGNNCITELNTQNNPELAVLFCSANKLSSLDLSNNRKLIQLDCNSNNISTIDLSENKSLKELYCANNEMKELNVSHNDSLIHLECSKNNLTNLDVTKNLFLEFINCSENNLIELDVSNNAALLSLSCINNPNLTKIYVKSTQQFQYSKDDTAEFVYVDGSGNNDLFDYYTSTDYSSDGEVKTLQTATIGNGIDIVLMGDAYSDRLIADGTYDNVMNSAMEKFFDVEPYKSFREYFNVYSVTAVSANEQYADATSTTFSCYFGDGTQVGGDNEKVFTYAQKVISEDKIEDATIIVMMNSAEYAGTCYMYLPSLGDYGKGASISYFPVGANDTALGQVLQHEACGHGFAKLGDEYNDTFNTQIPESSIASAKEQEIYGWLKNIDFTSDSTKVKWSKFLTDDRYKYENIGVYEGAFTYGRGAYRPSWNSIMRDNTGGFNAPSREAIYYRINKLAYGEDWTYDYETFVEYDAINRTSTASRVATNFKQMTPLHEPIIIKGSWKEAKNNVSSRAASRSNNNPAGNNLRNASVGTTNPMKNVTYSHRASLPNGKIMITSVDISGKRTVTYSDYDQ